MRFANPLLLLLECTPNISVVWLVLFFTVHRRRERLSANKKPERKEWASAI